MDPDPTSQNKSLVDETLDDHAECMESVARIEACLKGQPDRESVARLKQELPKLTETLRCHFSEEAQGPLYREVPVRHPHFADRLRKLLGEHGEIIKQAQQAISRAESLDDPELYELQELNAQVQLLVAKIRRHEAEENEIVVSAYWDMIGAGD